MVTASILYTKVTEPWSVHKGTVTTTHRAVCAYVCVCVRQSDGGGDVGGRVSCTYAPRHRHPLRSIPCILDHAVRTRIHARLHARLHATAPVHHCVISSSPVRVPRGVPEDLSPTRALLTWMVCVRAHVRVCVCARVRCVQVASDRWKACFTAASWHSLVYHRVPCTCHVVLGIGKAHLRVHLTCRPPGTRVYVCVCGAVDGVGDRIPRWKWLGAKKLTCVAFAVRGAPPPLSLSLCVCVCVCLALLLCCCFCCCCRCGGGGGGVVCTAHAIVPTLIIAGPAVIAHSAELYTPLEWLTRCVETVCDSCLHPILVSLAVV